MTEAFSMLPALAGLLCIAEKSATTISPVAIGLGIGGAILACVCSIFLITLCCSQEECDRMAEENRRQKILEAQLAQQPTAVVAAPGISMTVSGVVPQPQPAVSLNLGLPSMSVTTSGPSMSVSSNTGAFGPSMSMNVAGGMDMGSGMNMSGMTTTSSEMHYKKTVNGVVVEEGHYHN